MALSCRVALTCDGGLNCASNLSYFSRPDDRSLADTARFVQLNELNRVLEFRDFDQSFFFEIARDNFLLYRVYLRRAIIPGLIRDLANSEMPAKSRFTRLDAFTKTVDEARIRTTSGGVVTIASILIVLFLSWGEWADYRRVVIHPELIVDKGRGTFNIERCRTNHAWLNSKVIY